jgi:hypothetical protein
VEVQCFRNRDATKRPDLSKTISKFESKTNSKPRGSLPSHLLPIIGRKVIGRQVIGRQVIGRQVIGRRPSTRDARKTRRAAPKGCRSSMFGRDDQAIDVTSSSPS